MGHGGTGAEAAHNPHDIVPRTTTTHPNVYTAKVAQIAAKYPRMAVQNRVARPHVNIRRESHVRFGRMLIFGQNFDRNFVATPPKLTWRRIGRDIDAVC